jgi:hypothetical protein
MQRHLSSNVGPSIANVGLALTLLLLGTGVAARAEAQMSAVFLEYNGRGAPGTASNTYFVNWPVSRAECMANTPLIQVQINGAPYTGTGGTLVLALWTGGTGPGPAACENPMNRTSASGTPICTLVSGFTAPMLNGPQQTVALPPQALFGADCTTTTDDAFFLMASSTANDISTTFTTANFVTLRIASDMDLPGAPTLADASGDAAVSVTWSNAADTGTLSEARVFVDTRGTCGGGDGGTASSTLIPGGTPPSAATLTVTGGSPTSATLDAGALGLAVGQSAVIAVSVRDLARNESVLSNLACITRVEVEGFWEAYCREQGLPVNDGSTACRDRYDGCSVGTPSARGSAWRPALALSILALSFVGARIRKARSARRRNP